MNGKESIGRTIRRKGNQFWLDSLLEEEDRRGGCGVYIHIHYQSSRFIRLALTQLSNSSPASRLLQPGHNTVGVCPQRTRSSFQLTKQHSSAARIIMESCSLHVLRTSWGGRRPRTSGLSSCCLSSSRHSHCSWRSIIIAPLLVRSGKRNRYLKQIKTGTKAVTEGIRQS